MATKGSSQEVGRKIKEKSYVVLDFCDLVAEEGPHAFEFSAFKSNKYGGGSIGLKYQGKSLYVRHPKRTCPFGIGVGTQKLDKEKDKDFSRYLNNEKVTGYNASFQFQKKYDEDPEYQKAEELDEFFINMAVKYGESWNIGELPENMVRGIESKSTAGRFEKGKWLRLIKWSTKKDPTTKKVTYLEYPPRMETTFGTASSVEVPDDNGLLTQSATFATSFYSENGEEIEGVDTTNMKDVLPNFSEVSRIEMWSRISQGTYGLSLKPKLSQIRIYPVERLNTKECLLDDGEDGEDIPERLDLSDGLQASSSAPTPVKRSVSVPAPLKTLKAPVVLEDYNEDEVEELEELAPPVKAPAPKAATMTSTASKPVVPKRPVTPPVEETDDVEIPDEEEEVVVPVVAPPAIKKPLRKVAAK